MTLSAQPLLVVLHWLCGMARCKQVEMRSKQDNNGWIRSLMAGDRNISSPSPLPFSNTNQHRTNKSSSQHINNETKTNTKTKFKPKSPTHHHSTHCTWHTQQKHCMHLTQFINAKGHKPNMYRCCVRIPTRLN